MIVQQLSPLYGMYGHCRFYSCFISDGKEKAIFKTVYYGILCWNVSCSYIIEHLTISTCEVNLKRIIAFKTFASERLCIQLNFLD